MATYSFRIKKGKFQLDLSTTDKELLAGQFDLWVRDAGAYARKRKANECKELVNTQIKAEEEVTKKNIEQHISKLVQPKENEQVENNLEERKTNAPKQESSKDNLDIFLQSMARN